VFQVIWRIVDCIALWSSLQAVKNGKVTFIDSMWNYDDMLTSGMLVNQFPGMLEK
jgi:iron complex transport system substrate-binding protein